MKAFVLAAGFGTRMRPITDTIPKPMLPVGNVALIGYALRLAAHHGITDVVVNVHHLGKVLRDALGDGSAYGVKITYSVEEEILGTGGGLKKMHDHLADDTFVVLNSDTIIDLDLTAVIASHKATGALATMVLREADASVTHSQIEIDANNRIRRILGQGEDLPDLRSFMFCGVHVIEPKLLEYIPPDVNTCINRYAYTKALSNHDYLNAVVTDGYFADAGTPKRYFDVNVDALEQRMNLRHVDPLSGFALAPKREVAEVVRMGENVDLAVGARIVPPALLGDGARVGEHATVGPKVILGAKVAVGKEAHISQSILLEGVKVDQGAAIHRMIVGKKAVLAVDDGEA